MVNIIWGLFIAVGVIYALFNGKISIINEEILVSTTTSIELILKIFPMVALWLGIMNIAKKSGLLNKLAKLLEPILSRLFPSVPKGHESLSYISSNIVVNMLGLGSAATPFGLKAMKSLNSLNKKKNEASEAMVTFIVLNTSGLTLVPTTVISLRMMYGSSEATWVIVPTLIVTVLATISGVMIDYISRRRR